MPENSTCLADSVGVPVSGTLPKTVAYMTATVTGLELDTTYWCYVSSSSKKVTKCQDPLAGKTGLPQGALVGFRLLYQQLTSFFSEAGQEQVCRNMLDLVANGTCVIDSVTNGTARSASSEVSGSVRYDDFTAGQMLYNDLCSQAILHWQRLQMRLSTVLLRSLFWVPRSSTWSRLQSQVHLALSWLLWWM